MYWGDSWENVWIDFVTFRSYKATQHFSTNREQYAEVLLKTRAAVTDEKVYMKKKPKSSKNLIKSFEYPYGEPKKEQKNVIWKR